MSSELPKGFVTASHAVLFQDEEATVCDVCSAPLACDGAHDDDEDSFSHSGPSRGLLVWTRGEERRYQEPPLCSTCAAAIGVSALQRWEIEEDEG
jgi:hypothetical protein